MIGLASSASALAGDANAGVLDVITAGDNPAPITEGSGALSFGLVPPVGAACSGDTATAGYSVSSYMVPATVDPADLTFDVAGPVPNGVGSDFRQPLYSDGGTPFLSVNTAPDTGFLTNFVPLTLGLFGADGAAAGQAVVPATVYNLGYICLLNGVVDKFWNVQMEIIHDSSDPVGFTWEVVSGTPAPTTTVVDSTTTTTTIASGPTTTTPNPTTTDPQNAPGDTTTTVASSATTTTIVSGTGGGTTGGTTGGTGGGTTGLTTGSASPSLPRTGGSTWAPLVFWAALSLALGRIAVLIARNVVVKRPPSA